MIEKGNRDMNGDGPFFKDRDTTGKLILNKASPKKYDWDASAMALKAAGTSDIIKPADSVSQVSGQNSQGFRTGPLVTSLEGITPLRPDGVLEANDLALVPHYVWETGANSFNKYTGVIDSNGKAVGFDRPKFFSYVHTKNTDASGLDSNKCYGQQFLLRYEGFGQLMGIPLMNNGDKENQHFAPCFAIKSGANLIDTKEGKEVVIKMLEAEESMSETDASNCSSLSLSNIPELPSVGLWADPTEGRDLKDMSDVAPAVIEGVVQ